MLGTKLQVGQIIQVQGFVMLKNLNDGDHFVVSKIDDHYGFPCYNFRRPNGKKIISRHLAGNVDLWVKPILDPDINKIIVETA